VGVDLSDRGDVSVTKRCNGAIDKPLGSLEVLKFKGRTSPKSQQLAAVPTLSAGFAQLERLLHRSDGFRVAARVQQRVAEESKRADLVLDCSSLRSIDTVAAHSGLGSI